MCGVLPIGERSLNEIQVFCPVGLHTRRIGGVRRVLTPNYKRYDGNSFASN